MTINRLYFNWHAELRRIFQDWHKPQLDNFTWLLVGIYLSRSVHLSRIAGKIPGRARLVNITRRLSRFLDCRGLIVRATYEPFIRPLLKHLAQAGSLRMIIDGSKVGFHHQLLMVSVAYRKRAIPVTWTWVRCSRGHSSTRVQLAVLAYARTLLPINTSVDLTGDCEFGAIALIQQVTAWGWKYALRQKPTHQVKTDIDDDWQRISALVKQPGESHWVPNAVLTAKHEYRTNILAHWAKDENEPWLIATNHSTPESTLKSYSRRMWTEELFGDLKGHGFDLESTHLNDIIKLSRLTLAVVLLYIWLVQFGAKVIKNGLRFLVDRSDRRDLSIFQIGLRSIERCLTNALHFRVRFSPAT